MERYKRLSTPKLWLFLWEEIAEPDGTLRKGKLVSPDEPPEIIIADSADTVVQDLSPMTPYNEGIFYYQGYTIPEDAKTGTWNWEARAANGGTTIGSGVFTVIAQIKGKV